MSKGILSKIILILIIAAPLFLFSYERSEASVGSVSGKVYFTNQNGSKVYIPGARIYKYNSQWDYRTGYPTGAKKCSDVIRSNAINNYNWALAKYNCSIDPACVAACNANPECTKLNPPVPTTKPVAPTEADILASIKEWCRSGNGGVEGTSNGTGSWRMGNSGNIPAPFSGYKVAGSIALCPTGPQGSVSLQGGVQTKLNYCGFNCLENPHGLNVYFPPSVFDWLESNYPLVKFDRSDSKRGGGTWSTKSGTGQAYTLVMYDLNGDGKADTRKMTWDDSHGPSARNGYNVPEYYMVIAGNDGNYNGFDFEWIPPGFNNPPAVGCDKSCASNPCSSGYICTADKVCRNPSCPEVGGDDSCVCPPTPRVGCDKSCASNPCQSGLVCTTDKVCRNNDCLSVGAAGNCQCPVPKKDCDGSCTTKSDCKSPYVCSGGKCRNNDCPSVGSANNCQCPPSPTNNPPVIRAMSPAGNSPWIGTPEDSDNGPSCSDNNPYKYTIRVSDADGSSDIDRIEFNLARDDQLGGGGYFDWPLRIMFAKKWVDTAGRQYAQNTFFVRDAQVLGGASNNCLNSAGNATAYNPTGYNKLDGSGWSVSSNPSTLTAKSNTAYSLWCYGVDSHSWKNAAHTQSTINGKSVDVYYITNDISVRNDGYRAKLLGSNNGGWQSNTYVAYERGGDYVDAQFRVEYVGGATVAANENSRWMKDYTSGKNRYNNVFRVSDMAKAEDLTANTVAGEQMISSSDGQSHHKVGKTQIDFRYPTMTVDTPQPQGNDTLDVPWYATDSGGSRISRAWGDYQSDLNSAPWLWDVSGVNSNRTPASGFNIVNVDLGGPAEDAVTFAGKTFDNACNLNQNAAIGEYEYHEPWLVTRGGLVYSRDPLNITVKDLNGDQNLCPDGNQTCPSFKTYPFNLPRKQVALSTEWLSTGASLVNDHMINAATASTFKSETYQDLNNKIWYPSLLEKANKNLIDHSERFEVVNSLPAPLAKTSDHCSNDSKVCVIKTSGNFRITNEFSCDRQTFIFVNGSLIVSNKIIAQGNANGCIFAVAGNVVINPINTDSYDTDYAQYDKLEAFILSDGRITINPSNEMYGIQVWGALLGFGEVNNNSLSFTRYLKNSHNQNVPAYVLHHDARYYEIARKVVSEEADSYKQEVGHKSQF